MSKRIGKIDPKIRITATAIATIALILIVFALAIATFADDTPPPTNLQSNWF